VLVIGVEVITRILDPHDLDTMLFGDGAGAVILSREENAEKRGILTYKAFSHCDGELEFLKMGGSYRENGQEIHPKMQGKKVYRYAVEQLPTLVTDCLEQAGVAIKDVSKFLFHQANEKMIYAIADALFKRHGVRGDLEKLVPLTINYTGNSSVATIPTLLDLILRGQLPPHKIKSGDVVVMASVGAGMHANALVYLMP
jgi:3-oxoacyl-[acyl-carrier-protein] synthase-3